MANTKLRALRFYVHRNDQRKYALIISQHPLVISQKLNLPLFQSTCFLYNAYTHTEHLMKAYMALIAVSLA